MSTSTAPAKPLSEQYAEVNAWLQDLFRDEGSVPPFENNAVTIQALHRLCMESKHADALAEDATQDMKRRAEEYAVEEAHCDRLLQSVGVSEFSLSPTGKEHLQVLAELCCLLRTRNADPLTISAALSCHQCRLHETRHQLAQAHTRAREKRHVVEEQQRVRDLKRLTDQLEAEKREAVVEARWHEADVQDTLESIAHTKGDLTHRESRLEERGFTSDIMHSNLVDLNTEIERIQRECDELERQLQSVQPLPKDVREASIHLERAKLRRQRLIEQHQTTFHARDL